MTGRKLEVRSLLPVRRASWNRMARPECSMPLPRPLHGMALEGVLPSEKRLLLPLCKRSLRLMH